MNKNVQYFSSKNFTCNKFGHKACECIGQMMNWYNNDMRFQYFNGYCSACNGFQNKAKKCRSIMGGMNIFKNAISCYNCNREEHISKIYKCKKGKKDNLEKKSDLVKKDDLVEMKKEMERI